jgi:hypothetical protein
MVEASISCRHKGWGPESFVAGREIGFSTVPQMIEICRRFRGRKDVLQGLKPDDFQSFMARLKSCPDTKQEFFRSLLETFFRQTAAEWSHSC